MPTILITSATSGIGLALAETVLPKGADVIIASRNKTRVDEVVETLSASNPDDKVYGYVLYTSSLESVESFAAEIKKQYKRIDCLVNNAGIQATELKFTSDGFKSTFATNYLGHFHLVEQLLPLLDRIVSVSSGLHDPASMIMVANPSTDFEDWKSPNVFSQSSAYASSKLGNALHGKQLARRCPQLSVIIYDPGFTEDTGFGRALGIFQPLAKILIEGLIWFTSWRYGIQNQNSSIGRIIPF